MGVQWCVELEGKYSSMQVGAVLCGPDKGVHMELGAPALRWTCTRRWKGEAMRAPTPSTQVAEGGACKPAPAPPPCL